MRKILFLILFAHAPLAAANDIEDAIEQRKLEDKAIEEKQYQERLEERRLEQKRQDDKDWERRHYRL